MENIQSLLSSEKAWCPRYEDAADVDDLKVPECVETFVSLLVGITGMGGVNVLLLIAAVILFCHLFRSLQELARRRKSNIICECSTGSSVFFHGEPRRG